MTETVTERTQTKVPEPQSDGRRQPRRRRRAALRTRIWRERQMYVFILPGLAFVLLFAYVPLAGNVVAFQQFSPFLGIGGSPWIGLENFARIFTDPELGTAIVNTLLIALLQIIFTFPAPIALAILLNSLISSKIKRWVQSVVYLPHFISWVIVISIWQQILGGAGPVAALLASLGFEGVNIMSNPDTFKLLVTAQVMWKDIGWGTIIFFAAISAIPQELYEASAIDGARPMRQMWHVTLPGMLPVISLLLVLTVGNVLTVGFEQLLLQQPIVGRDAAQVIDTFVYFRGVIGGDWGLASAAGLVKGVLGTALVLAANRLAKRMGTGGVY
ncbi:ABC transporter permease [Ruania rhizosphaerae]|uniref:ABC transporter permease n=1 Tax=Ruania rhizosphaerae TaxID=1840413 RepID=UPI00135A983C|nr:ABC transporter permease subunit [Ruania rhizosphaerae]